MLGVLKLYMNRDSLSYINSYDIEGIETLIRGTLRRKGYCSSWNYFIQLGLTDNSYTIQNSEFLTYREYINMFLPYDKELF